MDSPLDYDKYASELDKICNSEKRKPLEAMIKLVRHSNTERMSKHP